MCFSNISISPTWILLKKNTTYEVVGGLNLGNPLPFGVVRTRTDCQLPNEIHSSQKVHVFSLCPHKELLMKQQWNTLSEKFFPYTLYHLESPEVKKPQSYHSPSFPLLLLSRPNPPSLSGSSFSARESTSMPLWPLRRDMIFITPVNAAWCDYWLDTQWSRNTEDTLIDTTESWIHRHHQHHQLHTTTNMIIRIVVAIFTPPEALMITVISERFTVLIVNATVFVTKTHVKPHPNPSLRAGFEARKWHRWHLHGWRFFHRHLGSKLRFWGSVWWISSDLYMIY